MKKKTTKKMGRPTYKPTPAQRAIVAALASFGISQGVICRYPEIHCTEKTLKKHYPVELREGKEIADGRVMMTLYKQAINPKPGNPSTMFYLKTRCNWRENQSDAGDDKKDTKEVLKNMLSALFRRPDDG